MMHSYTYRYYTPTQIIEIECDEKASMETVMAMMQEKLGYWPNPKHIQLVVWSE